MRFITEFELEVPCNEKTVLDYKAHSKLQLGAFLSNAFGWEERNKDYDVRGDKRKIQGYKLEIEAFSMDKWMLFKTKLFHHLLYLNIPTSYFDKIIE